MILVCGCKSEPAASPSTELEKVPPNPDLGGIALDDYEGKRAEPQVGPERRVVPNSNDLVPPEVARLGDEGVAAYLDQLDPRDLYLRGYQLKQGDPARAAAFFKQVVALTAESDPLHAKAKAQLAP